MSYKEGLFVCYRYWDTSSVKPQFPFGFGLSYTKFDYSNLKITNTGVTGSPAFLVSFTIKNTGNYDGAEAAQLYVHQQHSSHPRPIKELKGFSKLYLKKGETKTFTIKLDAASFSYYMSPKGFNYEPGMFDILIGSSSDEI